MVTHFLTAGLLMTVLGLAQAHEEDTASVIDLSTLLNMQRLLEQVADRRVVFVGEVHDRYEHHLNQLAVIKHQHQLHKQLAIGLEFFHAPFQPVLDDYIAGRIDEAAFLRKSEYFERWKYDYRLYRPIFRYAREQGIPLIALNTDSEITNKVKKAGINSLSEQERQHIPQEIDRSNADYRARYLEVFKMHPHAQEQDFERFLDVALIWDEGMAERAANWLREHPNGHMVILAGVGHLIYGHGIPDRLKRRLNVSTAIVLNSGGNADVTSDMGDFIIMAKRQHLPPSGKLGVFLDTEVSPPKVTGFSQDSGAKESGVKEGDLVTRIDGTPIESYSDIRIALMDKTVGEKVNLLVERRHLILGKMKHLIEAELR